MGTNEKIETIEKEITNIENSINEITVKVQAINSVVEQIKSEESQEITLDKVKDFISNSEDPVVIELLNYIDSFFDKDVIKDEVGWVKESDIDEEEIFDDVWDGKSSYEQKEFIKDWIDYNC